MFTLLRETAEHRGRLLDAIAQLDSYSHVLTDYADKHEEIPEMVHIYLIAEKIQEQISIVSEYFNENE